MILTTQQAISVLEKFEFYMDGGVRIAPSPEEFSEALAVLKDATGYTAPLPIMTRERTYQGHKMPAQPTGMFYTLGEREGKQTLHITGRYSGYKDVDITFAEGDTAVYDSFNFDYLGTIVKITEKAVTIKPQYNSAHKRLDLAMFANRNHNFSIERSMKRRMEWMD